MNYLIADSVCLFEILFLLIILPDSDEKNKPVKGLWPAVLAVALDLLFDRLYQSFTDTQAAPYYIYAFTTFVLVRLLFALSALLVFKNSAVCKDKKGLPLKQTGILTHILSLLPLGASLFARCQELSAAKELSAVTEHILDSNFLMTTMQIDDLQKEMRCYTNIMWISAILIPTVYILRYTLQTSKWKKENLRNH